MNYYPGQIGPNMDAITEGNLHTYYEATEGEVAQWYIFGLFLANAELMDARAFKVYADRWDICPSALTRNALCFGYYHAAGMLAREARFANMVNYNRRLGLGEV